MSIVSIVKARLLSVSLLALVFCLSAVEASQAPRDPSRRKQQSRFS